MYTYPEPMTEPAATCDPRTLLGLRVLLTRPAHQARGTVALLQRRGAEAVSFPIIAIEPMLGEASVARAVEELAARCYDVAVFTSDNSAGAPSARAGGPRNLARDVASRRRDRRRRARLSHRARFEGTCRRARLSAHVDRCRDADVEQHRRALVRLARGRRGPASRGDCAREHRADHDRNCGKTRPFRCGHRRGQYDRGTRRRPRTLGLDALPHTGLPSVQLQPDPTSLGGPLVVPACPPPPFPPPPLVPSSK